MKAHRMGLFQYYRLDAPGGPLDVDVGPSDTVRQLMARVGAQVGDRLPASLWDSGTREFHRAVHVFLDGVLAKHREQTVGDAREAVFLLQVEGGAR